jgi:hypothetical protein
LNSQGFSSSLGDGWLILGPDIPQSSLEALEVVSSTLPVDLRREEIAIRQLGKINSYKNTIPIKRMLEVCEEIEEPERHISPLSSQSRIILFPASCCCFVLDFEQPMFLQ